MLTIRGKRLLYYNEHTGPLIGQEVLAFYNLEMPELLTVCDMNARIISPSAAWNCRR